MGDVGKAIGGSFDPMTGSFNPAALFVPSIREDHATKREMMHEEIRASGARREIATRQVDAAVFADPKPGEVKAIRQGILKRAKAEGTTSEEAYRQVRARGFGKDAMAKLDKRQLDLVASRAELDQISKDRGLNIHHTLEIADPEVLGHMGLTAFTQEGSLTNALKAAKFDSRLRRGDARAAETLRRTTLGIIHRQEKLADIRKHRMTMDEDTHKSEMQVEVHSRNTWNDLEALGTELEMRTADSTRRSRWLKRHGSTAFRDPNAKGDRLSGPDVDRTRNDVRLSYIGIFPELLGKDADGNVVPNLTAADELKINEAGYHAEALMAEGGTRGAALAAATATLNHDMGLSPMAFSSPLRKENDGFLFKGGFETDQKLQDESVESFRNRIMDQRRIVEDPKTRKFGLLALPSPAAHFLQGIDQALEDAKIPAKIGMDENGRAKFEPTEDFGSSGLPLEYLDRLADVYEDVMNRPFQSVSEDAEPRRRRARSR